MSQPEAADKAAPRLLLPSDPAPFQVAAPEGSSPFFIVCDHAGKRIPQRLGSLGLSAADLDKHIGWDIGAGEVARSLGEQLDATTIRQTYSRLVCDCNRPPDHVQCIPDTSDNTVIPGNVDLSPSDRRARIAEIHAAYQAAIADLLDLRARRRQPTVIVSVHSFTPVMNARPRPWTFGVLHGGDSRFSTAVLSALQATQGLVVGDNERYQLEPETDYTVPLHAHGRGLDYLELEIRQDTIDKSSGALSAARLLADILPGALRQAGRV